ncbi:unnamed protein product, partial [marine sediment metagenome]
FGNWYDAQFAVVGTSVSDDIVTVFESQLGLGFSRDLGFATLNLRTVWETQIWMNDTLADSANAGSNIGFGGPTSSVELRF